MEFDPVEKYGLDSRPSGLPAPLTPSESYAFRREMIRIAEEMLSTVNDIKGLGVPPVTPLGAVFVTIGIAKDVGFKVASIGIGFGALAHAMLDLGFYGKVTDNTYRLWDLAVKTYGGLSAFVDGSEELNDAWKLMKSLYDANYGTALEQAEAVLAWSDRALDAYDRYTTVREDSLSDTVSLIDDPDALLDSVSLFPDEDSPFKDIGLVESGGDDDIGHVDPPGEGIPIGGEIRGREGGFWDREIR